MDRPTFAPAPARRRATALLLGAVLASTLVAACMEGRGAQDPSQQPYDPNNPYAQQPNPYAQPAPYDPNNPYAQQQPNPYAQQTPYPQGAYPQGQQYPGYGAPPPAQPAPVAAPASPLAIPCQNDLICGTHKCNLTSQRCSFPCAANTDCASGFSCMGAGGPTAICIPGGG